MAVDTGAATIEELRPGHWPRAARVYEEGITTGNATFETEVPSWVAWDSSHLPKHRSLRFAMARSRRKRLGKLDGEWRDVLLLERRSEKIN